MAHRLKHELTQGDETGLATDGRSLPSLWRYYPQDSGRVSSNGREEVEFLVHVELLRIQALRIWSLIDAE